MLRDVRQDRFALLRELAECIRREGELSGQLRVVMGERVRVGNALAQNYDRESHLLEAERMEMAK